MTRPSAREPAAPAPPRLPRDKLRRRYNGSVITLSENEERLVEALRALPPDAADRVITWATRLRDLANGKSVDWSDAWTEEDLADAQRASWSAGDSRV